MFLERTVYSQEHEIFRDSVRRFLEAEAVPFHGEWEKRGETPRSFWKRAGEQGLLCPQVPECYGGAGGDHRTLCVVNEVAQYCGVTGPCFPIHSDIVADYILTHGSEGQKQAWLPRMVSGDVVGAIAMTEPGTGSDLRSIATKARRDGDGFVLNGSKIFITNGWIADLVVVAARTEHAEGLSLFLVEAGANGFTKGRKLDKMGMKAQDTAELFFNDVRIPVSSLLGEEGQGFQIMQDALPQERLSIGVIAMSASQRAFDLTARYVKERRAFGKRLYDFQNTRFVLADLKTRIQAGWTLLDQCLLAHDAKSFTPDQAAMLKLYASELQGDVVDKCLQLFGGYGYMDEYPISRMYTDARVQRIYGGTSEIMKQIIGRSI